MDAATLAVVIPGVGGCILGALGFWQSRKKDTADVDVATRAAESTAKDVATRAAEAAIGALQAALDNALRELRELRTESAAAKAEHSVEMLEVRHEVIELRGDVEKCEAEKHGLVEANQHLSDRVRELELNR